MIIRKVLLPALLTGLLFALPFIFDILFFLIFISIACLFYFQDKLDIKIHKVTFVTISIAVWHFVVLFWFNHDVAVTFWDTIIIITFLIAVLLFFLNANIIAHKAIRKWRFFYIHNILGSNEIIKENIEMQTNRTLYAQFGYYPVLVLMVSAFFLTIKN